METEIERQHGWSPEMEIVAEELKKLQLGAMPFEVEYRLSWPCSGLPRKGGFGFRISNVAVVWPLWPPRGSEVRQDLRRRAKTLPSTTEQEPWRAK